MIEDSSIKNSVDFWIENYHSPYSDAAEKEKNEENNEPELHSIISYLGIRGLFSFYTLFADYMFHQGSHRL